MPIVRLTTRNVETLQARGGKRTDYVDALLPCFLLRVTPLGARSYAVAVKQDGRKRRINLGPIARLDLVQARERARAVLSALEHGEEPPPAAVAAGALLTVAGLVRRCLDSVTLRTTTRVEWERLARIEIVPEIGSRRAGELKRADVRDWLRPIRGRSRHTARHALQVLGRAYSWGMREDLVESSPCLGLEVERGPSGARALSAEELWALRRALERGARRFPAYASVTSLLLLTGVRQAAALGLRRDELHDLDGANARWVVPPSRSKSGREHLVPLSAAAAAVVRRRIEEVDELERGDQRPEEIRRLQKAGLTNQAIGDRYGITETRVRALAALRAPKARTFQHLYPLGHGRTRQDLPMGWAGEWRTWLRRRVELTIAALARKNGRSASPLPRWRVHDLRHTLATHLREDLGVQVDVVSLILGHTFGLPITRLYDRSQLLRERRAALEAWAAWLEKLDGEGR